MDKINILPLKPNWLYHWLLVFLMLILLRSDVFCQSNHTRGSVRIINNTSYDLEEYIFDYIYLLSIDSVLLKFIYSISPYDNDYRSRVIMLNSRTYTIEVDRFLNKIHEKRILFHEMVHVNQILSGKLEIRDSELFWQGSRILSGLVKYKDTPWEKEADYLTHCYLIKNYFPLFIAEKSKPEKDYKTLAGITHSRVIE